MFVLMAVMGTPVLQAKAINLPTNNQELNQVISTQVVETYEFSGMALYLNQVSFFAYQQNQLSQLDGENFESEVESIEQIIVVGRFNAMIIDINRSSLSIRNGQLNIDDYPAAVNGVSVYHKKELANLNPAYKSIRYHHLWWPLAQLSIFFESVLEILGSWVNQHWGWAIFIFAALVKIVFIPLSIVTRKVQAQVNKIQGVLDPELKLIKTQFDGEQAHLKIMAAHKKHGVSPFYTMKPLLMTLIQIPFLIAIFNTLGEMHELKGAGFLWVSDLSLPDRLFSLGFAIPMFGDWFNLFPFLMTGITLLTTVKYGDDSLPESLVKNQRRRLYLMAVVFFILFYPFPAAMVMYWALANFWQFFISRVFLN